MKLVMSLRLDLENGRPLRLAINDFCKSEQAWKYPWIQQWMIHANTKTSRNFYERTLLNLLSFGLEGQPILEKLTGFEDELKTVLNLEIEKDLEALPYKMMVPLLIFQFPAFLLLILGPLLKNLLQTLGGL